MQNRRDFLKTAAFAALGSGVALNGVLRQKARFPLCSISIKAGLFQG